MPAPKSTGAMVLSRRTLLRNGAAMAALAAVSPIAQSYEATQEENTMTQTGSEQGLWAHRVRFRARDLHLVMGRSAVRN